MVQFYLNFPTYSGLLHYAKKKVLVIVSKQKPNVRGYHWSALGIVFFAFILKRKQESHGKED